MSKLISICCLISIGLATSCATAKKTELTLAGPMTVDGNTIHFPAATAADSDGESLGEAMRTACDPRCDRVFVDVAPDTSQETLDKVVTAAQTVDPLPRLTLIPPSTKPLELSLASPVATECAAVASIQEDGIYVAFEGVPATPDDTCDNWTASVCRSEEGEYDWPRLRTILGNIDEVCVHSEIASTGTALDAVNESLLRPHVRLVGSMSFQGTLPDDAAEKALAARQNDIDWCYRQVLDDVPPSEVKLRVLVDADGEVARAKVVKAVRGTPQFEECIEDVAQKLEFDEPGGVVTFEQAIESKSR
jgi:hypothetical protein